MSSYAFLTHRWFLQSHNFVNRRLWILLHLGKKLLSLPFGFIPLGHIEGGLGILQSLQLLNVLVHEFALFDAFTLTLDRRDAPRSHPLRPVAVLRNRNRTRAASGAHPPPAQSSFLRLTAQSAVDALPFARCQVRLSRILHLLAPGRVLGSDDGAHLVEKIEVALLNLGRPF